MNQGAAAQKPLQKIDQVELVMLDDFVRSSPLKIDLVYARADHPRNIFGTAIYRKDAKMWAHYEMVPVILRAAELCFERSKLLFEIKDCLRTVEAQEIMRNTDIVKAHPEWLEEPNRMLAPPGRGGHPRGMAVDIILVDANGDAVDMGTPFDFLPEDRANNPSARGFPGFSAEVNRNRHLLEMCMVEAGKEAGSPILPLPQEWWDFRFEADYYNGFAPISDRDLPPDMRMTYLPTETDGA